MQDVLRKSRHQRKVRGAETRACGGQEQHHADVLVFGDVTEALNEIIPWAAGGHDAARGQSQAIQAGEHGAKRDRVEQKTQTFAEYRDNHPADRRANGAREIEHHCIERDRLT